MTTEQSGRPTGRKSLRVWPGVVAVVVLFLARIGLKAAIPGFRGFSLGMMWTLGAALVVLLWWAFFSRARWSERLGILVLMSVALFGTWRLKHESMGPLWLLGYAIPGLCLALVAAAAGARGATTRHRRATMATAILLACGVWMLFRTEGITGDHVAEFRWRWAKSHEQQLLARDVEISQEAPKARVANQPAAPAAETPKPRAPTEARNQAPAAIVVEARTAPTWDGFRGARRDGAVHGTQIATDWTVSPPIQLWRRPIGPGWSSLAVSGGFIYTQEQRGEDEIVACYRVSTGEPAWTHRDAARFFESNGGAGPRATPAVSNGRVYTFGATGILNALDARSGAVVWSKTVTTNAEGSPSLGGGKTSVPDWGFASSPLVVEDVVIVAAAGQLLAYELATGKPRWFGPAGGVSYSSPQLVTINGVTQILLMSGAGATTVSPRDGKQLWQHRWPGGFPIVQPAVIADGDVLIVASGASGTRRLAVVNGPGGWVATERWTSNGLKPYFNDFVVHKGYAFGFDGRILACIDLKDGSRQWKGGRYGNGQLLLLADQDVLLVLSEDGEVALVKATPDQFTELARYKAIEGKTWNHPVLAGDTLLVRNGEEMAAFRLSVTGR